MTPGASEKQTPADRIEKLERQNRRMKQAGTIALVLAGAVLLMGQAPATRTVEANEFVLKDGSVVVRGRWGNTTNGTYQIFNDASGKQRVLLVAEPDDVQLSLLDREGFGTIIGTSLGLSRREKTARPPLPAS